MSEVVCHKCKADDVIVYMTAETAICPKCCDDHEYQYEGQGDGHMCAHCGDGPPDDWYACDDDVGFLGGYSTSEVVGTPLSAMNGNAMQRHENPQAWDSWVAFCERNGLP